MCTLCTNIIIESCYSRYDWARMKFSCQTLSILNNLWFAAKKTIFHEDKKRDFCSRGGINGEGRFKIWYFVYIFSAFSKNIGKSCLDLWICDLVNHLTARMDKMKQNDRNQFYFEIFHSISRYQQTQGVQILAATSCLEIEKNASCAVNFVCC